MDKNYVWANKQIDGKWFAVCTNKEHVPMIELLKSGEYKITNSDGKSRIEKVLSEAKRFAISIHRKMNKFNKAFDAKN